jgi:hypothetical protein
MLFVHNRRNKTTKFDIRISIRINLEHKHCSSVVDSWRESLLLELALLGKIIQRGSESNANKVLTRDGDCSVNPVSQGHCTGVFIGARVPNVSM